MIAKEAASTTGAAKHLLLLNRREHSSMEQNSIQPAHSVDDQPKKVSQVLMIDGYKVRINYQTPNSVEAKNDVLSNIQKALLAYTT